MIIIIIIIIIISFQWDSFHWSKYLILKIFIFINSFVEIETFTSLFRDSKIALGLLCYLTSLTF